MKKNPYIIFEEQYGKKKPVPLRTAKLYSLLLSFAKHRLEKVGELIYRSNLNVLEIGCGDGLFLYNNRDKWKEITGVDVVTDLLNKAEKRQYRAPAHFIKADYGRSKMPYQPSTFDIVVSISVLQYLYDLDLFFAEVNRVLKKGGYFIFEVPNATSFWRRLQFLLGRLPRTSQFIQGWDAGVIHYFTQYDLEKYANLFGFKIKEISCSGIFDRFRSFWPSLLGGDLIFVLEK